MLDLLLVGVCQVVVHLELFQSVPSTSLRFHLHYFFIFDSGHIPSLLSYLPSELVQVTTTAVSASSPSGRQAVYLLSLNQVLVLLFLVGIPH